MKILVNASLMITPGYQRISSVCNVNLSAGSISFFNLSTGRKAINSSLTILPYGKKVWSKRGKEKHAR